MLRSTEGYYSCQIWRLGAYLKLYAMSFVLFQNVMTMLVNSLFCTVLLTELCDYKQ